MNTRTIDSRKRETDIRRNAIPELRRAGYTIPALCRHFGVSKPIIVDDLRALHLSRKKPEREKRRSELPGLFAEGLNPAQLAAHFHVSVTVIRRDLRDLGVPMSIYRPRRHDPNRIVDQMALDATCLLADVDLIAFEGLDRSRLAEWLQTFQDTQFKLAQFLRRLRQEQQTPMRKGGGSDGPNANSNQARIQGPTRADQPDAHAASRRHPTAVSKVTG